ncbi:unnamed protein product [Owenia fusiformis]|uniref:Cilia-and flagella-associated protein 96 n=1 Tax=Owenia fusiformis TaxID=6347 RepID=A0A8J1U4Y2_OWEFU|nr:unnamed protein product [Owenia fusiformis]
MSNKTDMERVGLFQEMNYHTIGDRYVPPGSISFNQSAGKGKQVLPGGTKDRSALQHGYFGEKYNRVFEGESYTDPIKRRRQNRLKESQKNIGKPFLPSNGDKKPSGLGNHYGTLTGPIGAFSPVSKGGKGNTGNGKNVLTNPGKKGTGFGYVGVTLGKYQNHMPDEYDRAKQITKKINGDHRKALKGGAFKLNMHAQSYFDANPYRSDRPLPPVKSSGGKRREVKPFKQSSPPKSMAGMKAGTFDPYPSHSADPYNVKITRPVHVVNKTGKIFMPSPGPKSFPMSSVVNTNVDRSMNKQNYKAVTGVMSY